MVATQLELIPAEWRTGETTEERLARMAREAHREIAGSALAANAAWLRAMIDRHGLGPEGSR